MTFKSLKCHIAIQTCVVNIDTFFCVLNHKERKTFFLHFLSTNYQEMRMFNR